MSLEALPQFDVAAALYREAAVTLYYLDHDPVTAAAMACDAHVTSGIVSAVDMLSCAWHTCNPDQLPLDAPHPYSRAFLFSVPPPQRGTVQLAHSADRMYVTRTGDRSHWLLCGQRIHGYMLSEHPNCVWARAGGSNYGWAHAWGYALAAEHRLRFGYAHPLTPMLWALEDAPPYLQGCTQLTEPAPIVPADSQVLDAQGYFDVPASYHLYYNLHKQPLMRWTNRTAPAWAQPKALGQFSAARQI